MFAPDYSSAKRSAIAGAIVRILGTISILIIVSLIQRDHADCNFRDIENLNTDCLREFWDRQRKYRFFDFAGDILLAISSFLFLMPILSFCDAVKRTSRQYPVAVIVGFAAACGISVLEFLFRAGVNTTADWVYDTWSLNDEELKTLTISFVIARGYGTWVLALDELFLFIGIIAAGRANKRYTVISPKWSYLAYTIGVLAFLAYCFELARMSSWVLFSEVGGLVIALIGIFLLPAALIWLGIGLNNFRPPADDTSFMPPATGSGGGFTEADKGSWAGGSDGGDAAPSGAGAVDTDGIELGEVREV
jgi:hypothetical protein